VYQDGPNPGNLRCLQGAQNGILQQSRTDPSELTDLKQGGQLPSPAQGPACYVSRDPVPQHELLRLQQSVVANNPVIANDRSRFSPDCICFPEKEQPSFGFPIEEDIAFRVKCPLHRDRFKAVLLHLRSEVDAREDLALLESRRCAVSKNLGS
jgi:hypothetical protein